jgi:TRAP transporter TAXI family solute receptor
MKNHRLSMIGIMILASLLCHPLLTGNQVMSAELKEPVKITFASMPLGSAWYVYAATMAQMLKKVLPEGSTIDVLPQIGGIGNPLLVSQGKADVAISNVATARWAFDGIYEYQGKQAKNIRALAGGLNKVFVAVIFREDFIKKTGLDSIEKIVTKKHPARHIMKTKGSLSPPVAEIIFSTYGVKPDDLKTWGGSNTMASPEAITNTLRDGRADFLIDVIPPGQPAVAELAMTADVRFLSLSDKERAKLNERGLYSDVMAPNSFKNQTYEVQTVNPGTVLIAHENVPEELAYVITKTMCEGKDELVKAHASLLPFDPGTAWKLEKAGIPLHPGAIKFYKEKGWMK